MWAAVVGHQRRREPRRFLVVQVRPVGGCRRLRLGATTVSTLELKGGTLAVLYGEAPGQQRAAGDLYCEPPEATIALCRLERFAGPIWDPACGQGNVLAGLRRSGYTDVHGSDAANDPVEDDFLRMTIPVWDPVGAIVCNPPYRLADAFVLRALALARHKVAMFLRLQYLEGAARYDAIYRDRRPHRVYVFKHRVGMDKGGVGKRYKDGMMSHAWFIWSQDEPPARQTVVDWIGYR